MYSSKKKKKKDTGNMLFKKKVKVICTLERCNEIEIISIKKKKKEEKLQRENK